MLVSSGAIAAGLAPLGLEARPRDLATQQAAASVGQGLLMGYYTQLFAAHGIGVGQVLLTVDDVTRHGHYRNAYRTFGRLLELGVMPIVNENDTVATHEIRFGDNDRLAALVAHLVHADALILLSDVDALYTEKPSPAGRGQDHRRTRRGRSGRDRHRVAGHRGRHRRHDHQDRRRPDRHLGRDPDRADLRRAGAARRWPASRSAPSSTPPASAGRPGCSGSGTPATPAASWCSTPVPYARSPAQRLAAAGRDDAVDGQFTAGEPVNLVGPDGAVVARGLVNYDADELPALLGRTTRELIAERGAGYDRTVVHRDALVVHLSAGRSSGRE